MDNQEKTTLRPFQVDATPRPWRTEGSSIKSVSHGKWFNVATAKVTGYTNEGNERNASLIVKAVNSHEALFEACRSAKLAMETSGLASGYGAKVYDRICQAIAKAEGR